MAVVQAVHHLNFLVRDLPHCTRFMEQLLGKPAQQDSLPGRKVLTARFDLGNLWLVLVQPTDQESVVGRILQTRGEGLFLLSLQVEDLDDALAELERKGIRADTAGSRQGLENWRVCDLQAPAGLGPVLQLCQAIKGA